MWTYFYKTIVKKITLKQNLYNGSFEFNLVDLDSVHLVDLVHLDSSRSGRLCVSAMLQISNFN